MELEADRLYCFSCGRPVTEETRAVPMCPSCERSGPHVEDRMRRWRLSGPGLPRSPMGHEEVVQLLVTGTLPESSDVAREGGEFQPLCAHPDFRALFLPGTDAQARLATARGERRAVHRRADQGKRSRLVVASLAAAASVGLAIYSSQSNLFVISAPVAEKVGSVLQGGSADVAPVVLPGAAMLSHLPDPASVEQRAPALLLAARKALLDADLAAARVAAEQAAALAPEDVEAVALLAEVYAPLRAREPGLDAALAGALERAQVLDAQAPATLRALAAFALAEGRATDAANYAHGCGAPVADILAGTDLRCALLLAEASGDAVALATIAERFPEIAAVPRAQARVALQAGDWGAALALGQSLSKAAPTDAVGWEILLVASAALGDWRQADKAGAKVSTLAPHALAERRTWARVQLRALRRAGPALTELEAIISHPAFAGFPEAVPTLLDAAEAAAESRRWDRAADLAAQALARQGGTAARLLLAWSQIQLKDTAAAQETMQGLQIERTGRAAARTHLGAARVFLALGDQRAASADLDEAIRLEPGLTAAYFDLARARLAVGDPGAVADALESAAFAEAVYETRRSPLTPIWIPPSDLQALWPTLEPQLTSDARFATQIDTLRGILAWGRGDAQAASLLESAMAQGSPPAAAAALAQIRMAANAPDAALPMLERALADKPNAVGLVAMQGYVLARKEPEKAASIRKRALTLDASSPAALYWNAAALERQGDADAAREAYRALQQATPGDALSSAALYRLHP